MQRLERNRDAVLDRVARVCREAGRDPAQVRLVAVTKSVTPDLAGALAELGLCDLGENRIDALERKRSWFEENGRHARWHYLGHVQRNKARRVVRLSDEIHSVDSLSLLEALERVAAEEERRPGIYLQVKLSGEAEKTGITPEELPALADRAASGALPLLGLMTMAPLAPSSGARATFERLAALASDLEPDAFEGGAPALSMGMSGDFEEALRAGADVLRIGTALFAEDPQPSTTEGRP